MSRLALRAGMALASAFPGRERASRIALAIGCSVRTAKYLLAGQSWTLERLEQVGNLLDWGVENWLPQPASSKEHEAAMKEARALQAEAQAIAEEMRRVIDDSRKAMAIISETLQPNTRNGATFHVPMLDGGVATRLAQSSWSVSFTFGEPTTKKVGGVAPGPVVEAT